MEKRLNDEHYYRKFYFEDSFHAQCMDVDPLTMEQFDRLSAQVGTVLKDGRVVNGKRFIGTGCGDSNIVAFAAKDAFEHYLPDSEYRAVEAIELSRHFTFDDASSDTIVIAASYSGGINRTIEALEECRKHGMTTVAMTGNASSKTAEAADILYYPNCVPGDNNAGLRTYYMNVMGMIILAAGIAEKRTGKPEIENLRKAVGEYHRSFWNKADEIDNTCFYEAVHWIGKKQIEIVADGPMFWAGRFIQAKVVELSGDPCTTIDSENYMHVNSLLRPGKDIATIVLAPSYAPSIGNLAAAVNAMVSKAGREVLVFSDRKPEEIGITEKVDYCELPLPSKGWEFLAQIYAYLPGALLADYRHTTIGEPMFRGGMDPTIFIPTYFSPVQVI